MELRTMTIQGNGRRLEVSYRNWQNKELKGKSDIERGEFFAYEIVRGITDADTGEAVDFGDLWQDEGIAVVDGMMRGFRPGGRGR